MRCTPLLPFALLLPLAAGCAEDAPVSPLGPTAAEGPCTGVTVEGLAAPDPATAGCATCGGELPPAWTLEDVQPQSCGHQATYGLNAFQGQVTLLAFFNAGCAFCQAQTVALERMRHELAGAGTPVHVVAVNAARFANQIPELTTRGSFPIFQDTDALDVWGAYGSGVSDFYLYGADGRLVAYLPVGAEALDLSTDAGYARLKQRLLDAR